MSAIDETLPAAGEPRLSLISGEWILRIIVPVAVFVISLLAWEGYVAFYDIKPFDLPAPSLVFRTLLKDWGTLSGSLLVTLQTTFLSLLIAVVGGVLLAILFSLSKWVELALFPYTIIMQVTPVIAIAPLLLIHFSAQTAILICAFLVGFFPILANTAVGLASADHNLVDLFQLSRASRWQTLVLLRLPSMLPYFLTGLRIAGGLSLIAAIVAELAAGSAGQGSGLAYRIVESGYRLNIPRMYAALVLISLSGIAIFVFFNLVSHLLLGRGHDSARRREA